MVVSDAAMKILFISNTLPFPSRDGVTVVATHYAEEFKKRRHAVDLLLLRKPDEDVRSEDKELNLEHFDTLVDCGIHREPSIRSWVRQLLGGVPYFASWKVAPNQIPMNLEHYDLVWVTPRAILHLVHQLRRDEWLSTNLLVGGVNDIASLRFSRMASTRSMKNTLRSVCQRISYRLQAFMLWRSERRLLAHCDYIHIQTAEEYAWVQSYLPRPEHSKFIVRANGVDDCLFEMPLEREGKRIAFIGALDGMYLERVRWFITECLPEIRQRHADLEVHVVGRCSNPSFVQWLESQGVRYVSFVEDICELYSPYSVVVAPIFKGYGLINKVIQAMSSGSIVVGDVTAYNGIPDFISGEHGLIAESARDFVEKIDSVLSADESDCYSMRDRARRLIQEHFRWSACADTVLSHIKEKKEISD